MKMSFKSFTKKLLMENSQDKKVIWKRIRKRSRL